MKSIEILFREHRTIEAMLDILHAVATRLHQGGDVPTDVLGEMLTFFEDFGDRCHHRKEEALLFPVLAGHGLGPETSPIQALSTQHEAGRGYLREMRTALAGLDTDEGEARHAFALSAKDYEAFLREHIRIEEHYFREIGEPRLEAAEDVRLSDRMAEMDRACGRAADPAWYGRVLARGQEAVSRW